MSNRNAILNRSRMSECSVLMISTSYPRTVSDWQGLFIRNLAQALSNNQELKLHIWAPRGPIPSNSIYYAKDSEEKWLSKLAESGGIAHAIKNGNIIDKNIKPITLLRLLRNTYRRSSCIDLYHINWLQNVIPTIGINKPAVISVLGSDYKLLDKSVITWLIRLALKNKNAVLAPNSRWMIPKLEKLFGDVANVTYAPFGIDKKWYEVIRRPFSQSRDWIAVLRVTNQKIGPLFRWGTSVFLGNNKLHLFGPLQEDIKIPDWVEYHGPVTAESLLNEWFPRAVGLISLSLHDEGRPQVMLEALAAGLPIIASNIDAHTDLLSHKRTGYIVNTESDLTEAIDWVGNKANNELISTNSIRYAENEFGTWDDCANRYKKIYQGLIDLPD